MDAEIKGVRHGFFDPVNLNTSITCTLANTSYVVYLNNPLAPGKKLRIKKLMWNNIGANGFLRIGYLTNAVAPVFVQCMPDIQMIAGTPDILTENEIPICGNTKDGFVIDNTVTTGSLGNIVVQSTIAGADISGEVEEI